MGKKAFILVLIILTVSFFTFLSSVSKAAIKTWQQVEGNGFGDANNDEIYMLVAFKGYIYVGTANSNGGEVHRSNDGTTWTRVGESDLNDPNDIMLFPIYEDGSYLYVVSQDSTNGTSVWRSSDGENYTQINEDGFGIVSPENNSAIWGMDFYSDKIYVAVRNSTSGAGVWRYDGPTVSDWTQINTDGFGAAANTHIYGLSTAGSYLYAATLNLADGGQLWRYNGSNWNQVGAGQLGSHASLYMYLGDSFNGYVYVGSGGTGTATIYRSTDGSSWEVFDQPGLGNSNNVALLPRTLSSGKIYFGSSNYVEGCYVYEYGSPLEPINEAGFGDPINTFTSGGIIFGDYLYISTYNQSTGGQIWRTSLATSLPQTGLDQIDDAIRVINSYLGFK